MCNLGESGINVFNIANLRNCDRVVRCKIETKCHAKAGDALGSKEQTPRPKTPDKTATFFIVTSYIVIFLVSMFFAVSTVVEKWSRHPTLVFLTGSIAAVAALAFAVYVACRLANTYAGRFSSFAMLNTWQLVLNRCTPFHPKRLCKRTE